MDIMRVYERVKNILLAPREAFPILKTEIANVMQIYREYVLLVAALPAVGIILKFGGFWSFGYRLRLALMSYLLSLLTFYISAFIVDALAEKFGSTKDINNAFKLVAYAATGSMVGQFFTFLGWVGTLLGFAGLLYSIYLFYIGLPVFMDTPKERVFTYMVAVLVVSFVVYLILGAIFGSIFSVNLAWR